MDTQSLTMRYDPVADELSLDLVACYVDQICDEFQPGVIVRSNPVTGAVENVDILNFMQHSQNHSLSLPLDAHFGTIDQALTTVT